MTGGCGSSWVFDRAWLSSAKVNVVAVAGLRESRRCQRAGHHEFPESVCLPAACLDETEGKSAIKFA